MSLRCSAISVEAAADPRFGAESPLASQNDPRAGGGAADTWTDAEIKNQRATTLSDPANPLSLFSLVDQSFNPNDPNNTTWTKTYTTAAGQRIVTTSPEGREKTQVLDNLGREVKSSLGDHHPTRKSYDANGRLSAIYEGPDPNTVDTRVTTISYKSTMNNQNGLMDTITDPLGRTVSFTYDAAGRIVSGTLPDSRTVSFTYDDNGNLTSITPPRRPAHEFAYTPLNQESEYTPPDPDPPVSDPRTLFTYNLAGNLASITRPDGGAITYVYDTANHSDQLLRKDLPSGQGSIQYEYYPSDAPSGAGQPHYITAPDYEVLRYSYYGSLTYQEAWDGSVAQTFSGSVERAYTLQRQLAAESVNLANPITYEYDHDGFMTKAGDLTVDRDAETGEIAATILGLVTDTYGRNDFGELTSYSAAADGNDLLELSYRRDKAGRIDKKTESVEGGGGVDTFYKGGVGGQPPVSRWTAI